MRRRDVLTPDQRRRSMQHNRGRTKPERLVGSIFWRRGCRYLTASGYRSLTGRGLPGSPDLVFSRSRVVVFVDGCFWHGCPDCKGVPVQSGRFWADKIQRNRIRDAHVTQTLIRSGWNVFRLWEHDLRDTRRLEQAVSRIVKAVRVKAP